MTDRPIRTGDRIHAEARKKDSQHRAVVIQAVADAMLCVDGRLNRSMCINLIKTISDGGIPNVSISF